MAFGSVYTWAYSVMELVVFSLLVILVVKRSLIQWKKISFPLFLPIIAFLGLIIFQMTPFAPSAIKLLSPKTHELYSQTLDGYSGEIGGNRGDQVAIDAVAAKLMGFDPMSIKFIKLAHEVDLGSGDSTEIEVVGEDVSNVNFGFRADKNTFASRGQKLIYWGPLNPLRSFFFGPLLSPDLISLP